MARTDGRAEPGAGGLLQLALGKMAAAPVRHHVPCGLAYGFNEVFFLPTLYIKFVQISYSLKWRYFMKIM